MPGLRVAVASGNWSNSATWDFGVAPVAGDFVSANGFTVNIDQNINVSRIATIAQGNLGVTATMTSNTTPAGYIASASSDNGTGWAAWLAFNKAAGEWLSAGSGVPAWLSYEFPTSIIIDRYYFVASTGATSRVPRDWTFQGWDGTSWVVLHTVTGAVLSTGSPYTSPTIGNTTAYIRYRINVTATQAVGTNVGISEMYLYEKNYTTLSGAVGGGFTLSGSYTLTLTDSNSIEAGTTDCLTFSGASPASSTINAININGSDTVVGASAIVVTNTGTLNITGNIYSGALNNTTHYGGIDITGAATVSVVGNIIEESSAVAIRVAATSTILNIVGNIYATASGNGGISLLVSNNSTINITGNVVTVMDNGTGWTSSCISVGNICTINLTGNIYTGRNSTSTPINYGITSGQPINLYITGNLYAGRLENGTSVTYGGQCVNLTGAVYVNHIGIQEAGYFTGSQVPIAYVSTGSGAINILTGPFIFGQYGGVPYYVARMHLNPTVSGYIQYRDNSTNGALQPGTIAPTVTYYPASTIADAPIPANVRSGVVYALGSQTGTLVVPAPGSVASGVVYDNGTLGTAVLTASAVWDALTSTMVTPGSIGERLKNSSTVATTGAQLAAFT